MAPSQDIISVLGPSNPNSRCFLHVFPPGFGSGLLHLRNRDLNPISPLHLAVQGEYMGGDGIHSEYPPSTPINDKDKNKTLFVIQKYPSLKF